MSSDDDEAASFFFAPRETRNVKQDDEIPDVGRLNSSSAATTTKNQNQHEDAAELAHPAVPSSTLASSLLSLAEVIQMSNDLQRLACEQAPKALNELSLVAAAAAGATTSSVSSQSQRQSTTTLPKMSTIELRRQQQKVSQLSETVVDPLALLVVRWEEEVVRNWDSLLKMAHSKSPDSVLGELETSYEAGNEAVKLVYEKKYASALKQLIGERRRELRLTEDLLNLGVW